MKTATTLMFALVCLALTLAACSTPQPGVSNRLGTLSTIVNAGPQEVTKAAEKSLSDLELLRITSASTELDGRATGYTASDKKITVNVTREGETQSRVTIRVGAFGDEDLGLAVLSKIEERVGKAADK